MKKSLYSLLVIVLTVLGAESMASKFDYNIEKVSTETKDKSSNENQGGKGCGVKTQK